MVSPRPQAYDTSNEHGDRIVGSHSGDNKERSNVYQMRGTQFPVRLS